MEGGRRIPVQVVGPILDGEGGQVRGLVIKVALAVVEIVMWVSTVLVIVVVIL